MVNARAFRSPVQGSPNAQGSFQNSSVEGQIWRRHGGRTGWLSRSALTSDCTILQYCLFTAIYRESNPALGRCTCHGNDLHFVLSLAVGGGGRMELAQTSAPSRTTLSVLISGVCPLYGDCKWPSSVQPTERVWPEQNEWIVKIVSAGDGILRKGFQLKTPFFHFYKEM